MADSMDHAARLDDFHRQRALSQIRPLQSGSGATHCEGCDDPIPAARRAVNPSARLCVECQSELEEGQNKGRGR